jgi:hypothetical protein
VWVRQRSEGEALLWGETGPGPDELDKALLTEQSRRAAARLQGMTRNEFDELFHEVVHLPEVDLALQVELPALMTPELMGARARR